MIRYTRGVKLKYKVGQNYETDQKLTAAQGSLVRVLYRRANVPAMYRRANYYDWPTIMTEMMNDLRAREQHTGRIANARSRSNPFCETLTRARQRPTQKQLPRRNRGREGQTLYRGEKGGRLPNVRRTSPHLSPPVSSRALSPVERSSATSDTSAATRKATGKLPNVQ